MSFNFKDIEKEIINTISKIAKIPREEIGSKQNINEIGVDSFTFLEVIFVLEEKFDITLPEENISITTLKDLAVLIKKVLEKDG